MMERLSRRMARGPFWKAMPIAMVAGTVVLIVVMNLLSRIIGFQAMGLLRIIGIVTSLPWAILGTRRLHDTNHSGWPIFLGFGISLAAPYVMAGSLALAWFGGTGHASAAEMENSIYAFYVSMLLLAAVMLGLAGWVIYWWCQPGDAGSNRFGPPPGFDAPPAPDDDTDNKPVLDFLRPVMSVSKAPPVARPVARPIGPSPKTFGKRAH